MPMMGYHGDQVINEFPNIPIELTDLQKVSGKNTRQIILNQQYTATIF